MREHRLITAQEVELGLGARRESDLGEYYYGDTFVQGELACGFSTNCKDTGRVAEEGMRTKAQRAKSVRA